MPRRFIPRSLPALAALLLAAAPAAAHQLALDCRVAEGKLRVEAYYVTPQKPPAAGATVVVAKETGEVVAEGKTDDRGLWSCPAPPDGKYVVRVKTLGHDAEEALAVGAPAPPKEEPGVPWPRVGLGLAIIALLFTGVWLARRRRPTPEAFSE